MIVDNVQVVTLTGNELMSALVERVERQAGIKVGEARITLVMAENAPFAGETVSRFVRGVELRVVAVSESVKGKGPALRKKS
jgi:hypothetical protein